MTEMVVARGQGPLTGKVHIRDGKKDLVVLCLDDAVLMGNVLAALEDEAIFEDIPIPTDN